MAGQSPMISLRIPEDYLLELERKVGFDGMRNKSDVIREAIRRYLATPAFSSGTRIEVELGPDLVFVWMTLSDSWRTTRCSPKICGARTHSAFLY